jgi:uncharacterized OB-fold protein
VHPDFPLPDVDAPLGRGFWAAAARGELAVPRCDRCARWVWYPTQDCRSCSSSELTWTTTAGRGTLFSWTEVRRALLPEYSGLVPYVAALVALDEDPAVRIVTRMVDVDPDALVGDMPVKAVFRPIWFGDPATSVVAPLFVPTSVVGATDLPPSPESARAR